MSRIVNRPIVVQADETGQPLRFVAHGHRIYAGCVCGVQAGFEYNE